MVPISLYVRWATPKKWMYWVKVLILFCFVFFFVYYFVFLSACQGKTKPKKLQTSLSEVLLFLLYWNSKPCYQLCSFIYWTTERFSSLYILRGCSPAEKNWEGLITLRVFSAEEEALLAHYKKLGAHWTFVRINRFLFALCFKSGKTSYRISEVYWFIYLFILPKYALCKIFCGLDAKP